MATDIPDELVQAVREGRAVLFLGSGASRGAGGFPKGDNVPDGQGLAKLISDEFLTPEYASLSLKRVYDLACNRRDIRTVQRFLYELFDPLEPADFHLLVPTFSWAGLAGTNYDRVVEKAYESQTRAAQRISVNTSDGDGATDRVGPDGVLYVKLHGCISRHTEVSPPMIASTEQFIKYQEGRVGQFKTFMEWATKHTLIFAGYSFDDVNLRELLQSIIAEGENRPRHYIVNKGVLELEAEYWRERRIYAIDNTFEGLLRYLDQAIPPSARRLGSLTNSDGTTFRRFITSSGAFESSALRRYFASLIEHVPPELDPPEADAPKFYSGFDLDWAPFAANLDVQQPVVEEVLREHVTGSVRPPTNPIVLIKGHAGSGKTVALRRICFDAATKLDKVCFLITRKHQIDVDRFSEIFSLTNLPVFLFIDNVGSHKSKVLELIAKAKALKAHLVIVATETFATWNTYCAELESFVGTSKEMKYLSEGDIRVLVEKLTAHGSLGTLKDIPPDQRIGQLRHKYGRQLLVALLEATHGKPLEDLIVQEYRDIGSAEGRLLYLDICSLHRFGPPVRAGLISRIHNIDFTEFSDRFFKPLEQIVMLREDRRSGDYVYEARHSFIADAVYQGVVKTEDDRFDSLVRIIGKLNPNYSYDLEVLGKLVRAGALENALANPAKIRQVYDVAEASVGSRPVIYHQRGIFELHQAGHLAQLDVAERFLLAAEELEPFNKSIKHSLAELDLRRSRMATEPAEKASWRKRAVERASKLLTKNSSPYPHHTLLKASIDEVAEALAILERDQTEAATLILGEAIAYAEGVLRKGLQAFPNEALLLAEEGNLSNILSQASRAEKAFEKAFEANPRSTLIAKRLSRVKRAKEAFGEAAKVLRICLEYNPGSQDLHYDYAMTLMEATPDAPQTSGETLLYHLRRSFTPGDRNRQAQFWYARQLAISQNSDDAKAAFDKLASAPVAFSEKTMVRGLLRNSDGSRQLFTGSIVTLNEDYGFVRCEQLGLNAFFLIENVPAADVDYLAVGAPLTFSIGFTLRGPVAQDISL